MLRHFVALPSADVAEKLASRKNTPLYFPGIVGSNPIKEIQYTRKVQFSPLNDEERRMRRRKIAFENWHKSVLLNGVIYIFLLVSASYIAHSNLNSSNYIMKQSLENIFIQPKGNQPHFTNVKTVKLFFEWMEKVMFPNFFPVSSVFSQKMVSIEKMFISDGINFKVGPARLRQLRVAKSVRCPAAQLNIESCSDGYSYLNEVKDPYCLNWEPTVGKNCSSKPALTQGAWNYTPASEINGVPIIAMWNTYSGGGYICNFEVNNKISRQILEELVQSRWVDRQTRAVFVEFTVYNPNFHMFAYLNFLIEIPESGGVLPYYIISVFRPYGFDGTLAIASQSAFVFCMVLLLIKVIYNLSKMQKAFFSQFWNVIDLFSLIFCLVSMSIFIIQHIQNERILTEFRTDPKLFVNFYRVVLWNEMISITLAFLSFFAIIRLTCVLGLNKTMLQISTILYRCVSELFSVSFLLFIYAAIYAMFGFLVFGTLWSYRSFSSALISVFLVTLGKSHFVQLAVSSPILGKIYFTSMVFFMVFLLLKMFESVLCECISAKENSNAGNINFMPLVLKYFKMLKEIGKKNMKVSDGKINKSHIV
ncbi:hypothetical protein Ahia01_001371000 [Argonauta hians]